MSIFQPLNGATFGVLLFVVASGFSLIFGLLRIVNLASLIRMANLYANVAQVGKPAKIAACLDLITTAPAQLMNLKDYWIALGNPADLVVLDCESALSAVAELAAPLVSFKGGRKVMSRGRPVIHRSGAHAR